MHLCSIQYVVPVEGKEGIQQLPILTNTILPKVLEAQ